MHLAVAPEEFGPTKEQQPSFDFCAVGKIKTNNVSYMHPVAKKCRQRCRAGTGCAAGRVFVVFPVLAWPRQIPLSKTDRSQKINKKHSSGWVTLAKNNRIPRHIQGVRKKKGKRSYIINFY